MNRTYLIKLRILIVVLCHYYGRYSGRIRSNVEASSNISTAQKAALLDFLAGLDAICSIALALSPDVP